MSFDFWHFWEQKGLKEGRLSRIFLTLTHSGVATKGPELATDADRPIDFFSVRIVPGVLGGVTSPVDRASTSLDSDSLPGLRTSFTDTSRYRITNQHNKSIKGRAWKDFLLEQQ